MTELLNNLKTDLLDRRLLPIVALVAVVLVAAVAYAVLGGSSSPNGPVAAPSAVAPSAGLATSAATAETAVAETTSGSSAQRSGVARNPFTPLAGTKTALTESPSSSSSSSGSGSSGEGSGSSGEGSGSSGEGSGSSGAGSGGSGSGSTGGSEPATPAKPSKPAKKHTLHHVAVLFGEIPAGSDPSTVELTPYENLQLLTPLPSSQRALIVYRGVTNTGKSATFTVVGEAILHGNGNCLPSAAQCTAIDLQPKQSEQLEYLPPNSTTPVIYELRVVSITKSKASTAGVKSYLARTSKAGRAALRHAGRVAIPFLHYTAEAGVLAFVGRASAHAHTAKQTH